MTPPPFEAQKLILHRPPMLMVERLLEYNDGDSGSALAVVAGDWAMVDSAGQLNPSAFPELVAQTYACVKGYEIKLKGLTFTEGYLVGIQGFEILGQAVAGDELHMHVQSIGTLQGYSVVLGEIMLKGKILAKGRIKLWTPQWEENA